jgi:uncharacterized NAD-dependent epimerase/dehydratase family protein
VIQEPEGNAIVYCQHAYGTTNGKTAHGLVRRTSRYKVLSVVDERHEGRDAGEVLDGKPSGIPIYPSVQAAVAAAKESTEQIPEPTHLVIGLAPDGGRLSAEARAEVEVALRLGLNVDSGLHDFLAEDSDLVRMAEMNGVRIRDVRKPPDRKELHFFSGKIEEVACLKVAMLGTDSAVGKRTTAWMLIDALVAEGHKAELVGTGQTAWMQGARFSIILDSLVNDFVAGEIEHAVWSAWDEARPDVILIEGQGSLMNPAYPGGHEILAAGRPDVVVLQHAPARREYDGFPGYPMHPLSVQIEAVELLSGRPVVAVAVNHEDLTTEQLASAIPAIEAETGLPACAPLKTGVAPIAAELVRHLHSRSVRGGEPVSDAYAGK